MILTAELPAAVEDLLVPPYSVDRLRGGYSWRTYAVRDANGLELIVRVAPRGGTLGPYDAEVERRALERVAGTVPAPTVIASGTGYIVQSMARGRVLKAADVTEPSERALYADAFAATLGRLHRLGAEGTVGEVLGAELDRMAEQYREYALRSYPGFLHGLDWLRQRLPDDPSPARFCHGDYRFANLAWTAPGELSAVLDWERAGPGDPHSDIAFSRLFSGWCAVAGPAVKAYEAESGIGVDEARVAYLMRFERVRSYTASMRGHRAFRDGLNDDSRLQRIGEAGEVGMEELLAWH